MSDMISKTLWMYGLAIIVSLVIAAIIKAIVYLLGRIERQPASAPAPKLPLPAPAPSVPAEHIAAIAAAVQAMIGQHRVLRIDDARQRTAWLGSGRLAHHRSHDVHSAHHKR